MNLIKHEVYKVFSQKVIYVALAVFSALCLFDFYSSNDISLHQKTREVYKSLEGKTTEERIAWAKREYEEIKKRPNGEQDDETTARTKVAINILNSDNPGNEELYDLQSWKNIIRFTDHVGFYFIGGLVILGLSNIFSYEYNTRMDSLIFSSKHGRRRITLAKVAAVAVYCSAVCLFFSCLVFVLNGSFLGLDGWNTPLETMVSFYMHTSFEGPIWLFYGMQQLYVIAGSIMLGLLVTFLSSFTKFPLIPAFIAGFIFLLPDVLSKTAINIPYFTDFVAITFKYNELVRMERLGGPDFVTYDIFGIPMSFELYVLILMIVLFTVSCLCIDYKVRKRQVI
ncbi:hypothetical protein [Paenibacillus faecalis]|uniref:hypothetical protein n=1 Tax=Paenibacillus faecalis TaxID=2079532 RepID=UPI000D0FCE0E|nr:hypothetical protein [Paenibacillus faecalis]